MEVDVGQSLLYAVESGDIDKARTLLQTNQELVNRRLGRGTALHLASERGNVDMCRLLLQFGANMCSTDSEDNDTPVCKAARGGHVPILGVLKERGCSLDVKNGDGNGPLVLAAGLGHAAAVQFLVDNGVNVNERHQVTAIS